MTSETASYLLHTLGVESEPTKTQTSPSQVYANGIPGNTAVALGVEAPVAEESAPGASPSDEVLLERLGQGDKEALGILFRRYARMVRTVAHRIVRNASEADDLLQEVFLFIFQRRALFDANLGSARSWIVQVTYHRAIDRRRYLTSRHFYTSLDLEDAALGISQTWAESTVYEQSMEVMLGKETMRKIAESLSDDQRTVIQLYFFEGYKLEEIATRIGQTVGNIRNHYYRALEKMRKHIFVSNLPAK